VALGLSGQMHSSVFLDRAGAVVRPALLWCDGRTTAECAEITRRVGGEQQLRDWVRNPALEGFTLPKVLWLRRHEPAAYARLAAVLLAKDFVRLRLTGAMMTEPSDASGTLMFDPARLRWSDRGARASRIVTADILRGLLALVEEIERGALPADAHIVATSYFFSDRTVARLGFELRDAPAAVRHNLAAASLSIALRLSFTRGRPAFPDLRRIRQAATTAGRLAEHADEIRRLLRRLPVAPRTTRP